MYLVSFWQARCRVLALPARRPSHLPPHSTPQLRFPPQTLKSYRASWRRGGSVVSIHMAGQKLLGGRINNSFVDETLNTFVTTLTNTWRLKDPIRYHLKPAYLPGLRSSLRLDGESMRSRASAASKVLSEQWTLVPWTEASTTEEKHTKQLANTLIGK